MRTDDTDLTTEFFENQDGERVVGFDAGRAARVLIADVLRYGDDYATSPTGLSAALEVKRASKAAFRLLMQMLPPSVDPRAYRAAVAAAARGAPRRAVPVALTDWHDMLLLTSNGGVAACQTNAALPLLHDPAWRDVIAFDTFRQRTVMMSPAPWVDAVGFEPRPWTDADDLMVCEWLQKNGVMVGREIAGSAVERVAHENLVDALKDYVESLWWDGTPRLDTWLVDYCGADDTRYVRAVGAAWLKAAVARALHPGCKADAMLILLGDQGIGKSTAASIIGGPFYNGTLPEIGDKDAVLALHGSWVVEIAELDSMSRRDASTVKAFLSTSVDRFRPPYGKRDIESRRRCVFIGTVNEESFLRDATGGRRFWPVECRAVVGQMIDTEGLRAVREQLIAEAVHRVRAGEAWHLSAEVEADARVEQEARRQTDPWEDVVLDYVKDKAAVTVQEVMKNAIRLSEAQQNRQHQMRVAGILTDVLRWKRRKVTVAGARVWRYESPDAGADTPPHFNPHRNIIEGASRS